MMGPRIVESFVPKSCKVRSKSKAIRRRMGQRDSKGERKSEA